MYYTTKPSKPYIELQAISVVFREFGYFTGSATDEILIKKFRVSTRPSVSSSYRYTPLASACPASSRPSQLKAYVPADRTPFASVAAFYPAIL